MRIEIVGTCDEVNALLGMVLMEANRLSDTHSDGGTRITVKRKGCMQLSNRKDAE